MFRFGFLGSHSIRGVHAFLLFFFIHHVDKSLLYWALLNGFIIPADGFFYFAWKKNGNTESEGGEETRATEIYVHWVICIFFWNLAVFHNNISPNIHFFLLLVLVLFSFCLVYATCKRFLAMMCTCTRWILEGTHGESKRAPVSCGNVDGLAVITFQHRIEMTALCMWKINFQHFMIYTGDGGTEAASTIHQSTKSTWYRNLSLTQTHTHAYSMQCKIYSSAENVICLFFFAFIRRQKWIHSESHLHRRLTSTLCKTFGLLCVSFSAV